MPKTKIREITLIESKGSFGIFKKTNKQKEEIDFESVSALRKLLNIEKARILSVIKSDSPDSIYQLAKILKRSFKSVFDDVKLLERFGFISLVDISSEKRRKTKPVIDADTITIHIKI